MGDVPVGLEGSMDVVLSGACFYFQNCQTVC